MNMGGESILAGVCGGVSIWYWITEPLASGGLWIGSLPLWGFRVASVFSTMVFAGVPLPMGDGLARLLEVVLFHGSRL